MAETGVLPAVTIAITRYAEADETIRRSLAHALGQQGVKGEVVFVEQAPDSTISQDDFPDRRLELRVLNRRLPGLSAARNLALDEGRNRFVLFLDADALAEPDWAARLAQVLSGDEFAIAGGKVVPHWPGDPPLFARAVALRDQYSLIDLGEETMPYRRVVGAGFGADMGKLPGDFRFDPHLGRRDGLLFGGEESDFCARAKALGFEIAYVGGASVTHLIEAERCRWSWILKRMLYAGHGRARLGGGPSASRSMGFYDYLFLPAYLPFYATGWLWGKLS